MSKFAFIFFLVCVMSTPLVSRAESWKEIPSNHNVYYDESSIERLQNKVKVETRIQMASDGNIIRGGGYQATIVFDCNHQTVKAISINQTMWGMPNPPTMELTRFRGQIILCEGEVHDVETPPLSPGIP